MKELIQRVKDASEAYLSAQDAYIAAIKALKDASTQFPIGSTVTVPDDDDEWPGELARVDHKILVYSAEKGLSWCLTVMVIPRGIGRYPTMIWKPFVEEPA